MGKLLEKHPEEFLAVLVILQLIILACFYVWGVHLAADSINQTTGLPSVKDTEVTFDIEGAKSLNLRNNLIETQNQQN